MVPGLWSLCLLAEDGHIRHPVGPATRPGVEQWRCLRSAWWPWLFDIQIVAEPSVKIWDLLSLRGCLARSHWEVVASERVAACGLRHGRFHLVRWAYGQWSCVCCGKRHVHQRQPVALEPRLFLRLELHRGARSRKWHRIQEVTVNSSIFCSIFSFLDFFA